MIKFYYLTLGFYFCTLQREAKIFRNTGRCRNESQNNASLHTVQTTQLRYYEKQKTQSGQDGNEQALSFLHKAYSAQRNEVI